MAIPRAMMDFLQRKYDIMQQQANAGMIAATSAANLDNVRAGLLPAESRAQIEKQMADIGLTNANVGLTNAETGRVAETTKYIGPLAQSEIGYRGSAANLNRSQALGVNAETEQRNQINKMFDIGGMSGLEAILRNRGILGGL